MRNTTLRRLSTCERFFSLLNQTEPVHFVVAAQVEGATNIDQWKKGLSCLQRRHPFLMASIEPGAQNAPYFVSRPGIPIPLRVVEGNAVQRLEVEVARELATPFRVGDALLVRAVVLHEKWRSIVILAVHHAIADGLSLAFAIRDLLQALSGETLAALPVPSSHEALLGLKEVTGWADGRNGVFEARTDPTPESPVLAPRVSSLRLRPDLAGELQEIARREQASVHGALASSLVFAVRKLVKTASPAPLRLASPISTRKQLNQGDDCVLLTDVGILELDIPSSGDFWELARRVRSDLSPQTSLDNIAERRRALQQALANMLDAEEARQFARQAMNAEFVLTNLGNLSFERQHGQLSLEALWLAILVGTSENQHVLGVATVQGSLSLMYCSYNPIPKLLESMESFLMDACAHGSKFSIGSCDRLM